VLRAAADAKHHDCGGEPNFSGILPTTLERWSRGARYDTPLDS